jgi:myo-inositol-1(or 4)-monophosphatase
MIEALRRKLDGQEQAWFLCMRAMASAGREAVLPLIGTKAGRQALGRGGGGDETMELDRAAEAAMLEVLARLAPEPCTVISEEAGSGPKEGSNILLIDPVDGSLNAKRGLEPFAGIIALADGPHLSDVRLGYVHNYTRGYAYLGVRGAGMAATTRLEPAPEGSEIEVIMLEAGRPDLHRFAFDSLSSLTTPNGIKGMRVRQMGSLGLAICQVAIGTADAVVTPVPSRAVDIAAALLMLRESGGGAAALDGSDIWEQPLDLQRRSPLVGWRAGVDGEALTARALAVFGT